MRRLIPGLVMAFVLSTPASAFLAQNNLSVAPQGNGFVVSWGGASGAPAFWCAAGDYVVRGLGLPTGTRIYRTSPPPRGQGEGIAFGFDEAQARSPGLLRLATSPGMSAALARRYCERGRR